MKYLAAIVTVAVVVATDVIDVTDGSHCVDVAAIPTVPCCCQVFDANDNDNDFVDFRALIAKKKYNEKRENEKKSIILNK